MAKEVSSSGAVTRVVSGVGVGAAAAAAVLPPRQGTAPRWPASSSPCTQGESWRE